MSTYTSQQARLRAARLAKTTAYVTSECQRLVDAIIDGFTSTALKESSERLRAATPTSPGEVTSLITNGLAELPLVRFLPADLATSLTRLKMDADRAETLAEPKRVALLKAMVPRLADLSDRLSADVGRVERLETTGRLSASLRELGYSLTPATGTFTSAIEASRGHEKVLVIVKDGGEVTTDWAGLRDAGCLDRQTELKAAAARHGLDLGGEETSMHHDPRGGLAIAAAAKQHAPSLAAGAVIDAEMKHDVKQFDDEKSTSRVRVGA